MTDHRDANPVLVTGATGGIGAELVRLLVAAGEPVRAMCRRPEQFDGLRAAGAEPVLADFDDEGSLRTAMTGCDRVFLLTAPSPQQLKQEKRAIAAAVAAGVRKVVRVSASDSNTTTGVPWARAHAFADAALAATDLDWTVLRPSAFLQNLAGSAPTIRRGLLPQTTGRGALAWIDSRDVAEVAARVLTTPGHARATYFLTGPEPLTMTEVAERTGRSLGHPVRFLQIPSLVFLLLVRFAGRQSWWMSRGLRVQFAGVVRPGHDNDVTHEVERLLGRPPRRLEDYLRDHEQVFAPGTRRRPGVVT